MNAPVLVTGGAGYVGSHVALALCQAGYRVTVVDDLSTGRRDAVPAGAILARADVGDAAAVRALIAGHGIVSVLHLAGAAGIAATATRARRDAAAGTRFVHACAEGGVKRFVHTSSAAVYGAAAAAPGPNRRPAPVSPYGAAKLETEGEVRAAFPGAHAVLRCFNVAGADPAGTAGPRRGRAGLVEAACEAALGLRGGVTVFGTDYDTADGTCVRDYIHPGDVAAVHLAALRALERGAGAHTLDCGRGEGRSVREVLEAVRRLAGTGFAVREGPRRRGDVAVAVARPGPTRRILGWRPAHGGLDAVVGSALAWIAARSRPRR